MVRLTLEMAFREMREAFASAGIENPGLDARILVEHVSGAGRGASILNPHLELDDEAIAALLEAQGRRTAGEPVHRITGMREFFGLGLLLGPDTLEPRPDTETLVDAVLPFVHETAAAKGACRVLDLGTGTGAVGLAIAAQNGKAQVTATDVAAGAVEKANQNARKLGLGQLFRAIRSDWFDHVSGRFDLIVSNPPYIPTAEIGTLDRVVRDHDPLLALDGGADGLDAYRVIGGRARSYLAEGGRVGVEIGAGQAGPVTGLFIENGYSCLFAKSDLSGTCRALVFR